MHYNQIWDLKSLELHYLNTAVVIYLLHIGAIDKWARFTDYPSL